MSETEPCYHGPCATCGNVHGGWEPCDPEILIRFCRTRGCKHLQADRTGHALAAAKADDLATWLDGKRVGGGAVILSQDRACEIQVALEDAVAPHLRMAEADHDSEPWQRDIQAILITLGLGDHGRPQSCHRIVHEEILPAIATLRGESGRSSPEPTTDSEIDEIVEALEDAGVPALDRPHREAGARDLTLVERIRFLIEHSEFRSPQSPAPAPQERGTAPTYERERALGVIRAYVDEERRAKTRFNDLNAEAVEAFVRDVTGANLPPWPEAAQPARRP